MRFLLDTVTFIWMAEGHSKLSAVARSLISDASNEIFLSAASAWEIAVKHDLGRLELQLPPDEYLPQQRQIHHIESLSIDEADALQSAKLPDVHRDPFDRILIAQAILGGMAIVTPDRVIRRYPVRTVW
ncbi:MAG: type II toxin-antitoxin system VapC family toxin [Bryobacterales bacterium]|nr:type II toxin-antitoxin system VapC family toxin [Bryobacterales bacterium]MDE0265211.1 type II toxin-antitoxin system VapC family toxin [Bryobacterales bacterium]